MGTVHRIYIHTRTQTRIYEGGTTTISTYIQQYHTQSSAQRTDRDRANSLFGVPFPPLLLFFFFIFVIVAYAVSLRCAQCASCISCVSFCVNVGMSCKAREKGSLKEAPYSIIATLILQLSGIYPRAPSEPLAAPHSQNSRAIAGDPPAP